MAPLTIANDPTKGGGDSTRGGDDASKGGGDSTRGGEDASN